MNMRLVCGGMVGEHHPAEVMGARRGWKLSMRLQS
jgi:hypothetical protein